VRSYLVETYLSRGSVAERTARERRARVAAEELTREQTTVLFEQSIHIPEDEICFYVFRADSSTAAALVAQRAELEPLRVVEVAANRKEEK
jgi:hypothetical protein